MRLIDADKFLILESAAYVEAQAKINDKITRLVNEVVHKKNTNAGFRCTNGL